MNNIVPEPSPTKEHAGRAQPLTRWEAAQREGWRLDPDIAKAQAMLEALQKQGEDRIWRAALHISRVLDEVIADRDAWRDAMQRQTPMGSEFCSPAACEAYANERRRDAHEAKCEVFRLRRALAESSTGRLDTSNPTSAPPTDSNHE